MDLESQTKGDTMSLNSGLKQLGFVLTNMRKLGDYVLQDNSDGKGPFIAEWTSAFPQPSEAEILAASDLWDAGEPMRQWELNIKNGDKWMDRDWERFYDNNPAILATEPQKVKDRYSAKTTLRGQKP